MKYSITNINDSEGWIFISSDNSYEDPKPFIDMVKMISHTVIGKITSVGDTQYQISNTPYDLVFQWDDLFGIVIILKNIDEKSEVLAFLEKFGIK